MPDPYRVVDEIRAFVQSSDQTLTDNIRDLASEFAEICKQADIRLRRCEEFLTKGLRGEAIQLAEAEPKLLDLLMTIDFAERWEWDNITMIYGLPSATPLNVQRAAGLNAAYAEHQPLEALLREHRRLAISRSPLKQRLEILHRIAALDKKTPVWQEDIRSYEDHRFREMRREIDAAVKMRNGSAALAIHDELQQSTWLMPPPQALVKAVTDAATNLRADVARAALPPLVEEMTAAAAQKNIESARLLRARWYQLAGEAMLVNDDPLAVKASRMLVWLEQAEHRLQLQLQEQQADLAYEQSVNRFEVLLGDPEVSLEELQDARADVLRHQRGVPRRLEELYQDQLRSEAESQGRSEKYVLIGVSVIGLFGLIGFLFWLFNK